MKSPSELHPTASHQLLPHTAGRPPGKVPAPLLPCLIFSSPMASHPCFDHSQKHVDLFTLCPDKAGLGLETPRCLARVPGAVRRGPPWPSGPSSPRSYPGKFSLRYSGVCGYHETRQVAWNRHPGLARVAWALDNPLPLATVQSSAMLGSSPLPNFN